MSSADPFVTTLHHWIEFFMHHSMCSFFRYAKANGLSMSQLGALFHLHHLGISGVTDLGDHLGVTSAAVSQLLDRLIEQELILRTENPNDRRGKQITLTDKGCQILREGIRDHQNWLNDLRNDLSDLEKEQITTALKLLINKAKHLNPIVVSEV